MPLTLGATAASTVRESPARQTFADKQISSLLTGPTDRVESVATPESGQRSKFLKMH